MLNCWCITYPAAFGRLIKLEFSRQIFRKISNSMKICPVGAELLHVDGRTDKTKLVASRDFSKAPEKVLSSAGEPSASCCYDRKWLVTCRLYVSWADTSETSPPIYATFVREAAQALKEIKILQADVRTSCRRIILVFGNSRVRTSEQRPTILTSVTLQVPLKLRYIWVNAHGVIPQKTRALTALCLAIFHCDFPTQVS